MKNAVFAGSFDPVTIGHVELVRRLSEIFDRVYFLLAINAAKTCYFPREDRLQMMRLATENLPNVTVDFTEGYVYEYARAHDAVLARGVRSQTDYTYERMIADNNRSWAPEIQTVFLMADPAYCEISSTEIRDQWMAGKLMKDKLPPQVAQYLAERRDTLGKQ